MPASSVPCRLLRLARLLAVAVVSPWVLAVALVGPASAAATPPTTTETLEAVETVERSLVLMGTTLRLTVRAADRPAGLAAAERAVDALEAVEARLSTWRPDSELSRLNRAPAGHAVALTPETVEELAAAARCRDATGGAFDPAVGALVDAWALRQGGRRPAESERAAARASVGPDGWSLAGDGAMRHRSDLRLEEGGFGKGAGLDRALDALEPLLVDAGGSLHSVQIDLGGQVAILEAALEAASTAGSETARVLVAHPRHRTPVAALDLSGTPLASGEGSAARRLSVATSGNAERGIVVDGQRLGHLLDPRTGAPAVDFGSVTVVAASALEADCLATALAVLGPDEALAWVEARPGVEALVVEASMVEAPAPGREPILRPSSGLAGALERLAPVAPATDRPEPIHRGITD